MGRMLKQAEILCVGTEILIGDIVNTNAAYISEQLAALGISQHYQAVVGDNSARLGQCIREALGRCDLLILSGGLGPTYDDLTKETAAAVMGRSLVVHAETMKRLEDYFSARGRTMTENNRKQALIPEGAVVFDNDNGTAPGLALEDDAAGKVIVMLPGPPRELIPLFRDKVRPYLLSRRESVLVSHNLNVFGMGESAVEAVLAARMRSSLNPTVAPYCGEGEMRLRITAQGRTEEECEALCSAEMESIRQSAVGPFIYGEDTDLPTVLVQTAAARQVKFGTAESCTGGLIASMVTDVPGASEVFMGSIVSYANEVKEAQLGVHRETLGAYGAVSRQTAEEMAVGLRHRLNLDYAVSVTGIAGPGGGTPEKPVGLVWLGVAGPRECRVQALHLQGSRHHIRHMTALHALAALRRLILDDERKAENS